MSKKICAKIIAIIAIAVIMLAGSSALAYTGDGYSIDIPSTYTSGGSNAWVNSSEQASVNIQITTNSSGETISTSTLNEAVNSLKSSMGDGIVVEKSEITKLNGADAIHIVSSVSGMYLEQYAVVTKDKVFVLTIGAMSKSYLSSSEATGIVNSFKVTGATSSSSSSNSSSTSSSGYSNNSTNTSNTSTSNVINQVNRNNTSSNTSKYVDDDDDEEEEEDDDEDEKTTKKSKSSKSDDDDESNTWIIVAIIAGVIVVALIAIVIIVAIVASSKKNKQQ